MSATKKRSKNATIVQLPALQIEQGRKRRLYSFAIDGKELHRFCTISRINRSSGQTIDGYQRPEIMSHITEIRNYVESEDAMLPNAIVVAFDDRVVFKPSRQSTTTDLPYCRQGLLEIPIDDGPDVDKPGWIVDGQQRAAAIRDAKIKKFPICVIGFIANSTEEQRQQFILVNATKPLPKGLIYELLPSTNGKLPVALRKRKYPAEISERLNYDKDSPLFGMIRTPTNGRGVIADNSVLKMIENSLSDGVLYRYHDTEQQLMILKRFWESVRHVFEPAWNLPPKRSRLMHGAGVIAMGFLMDTIADRHRSKSELSVAVFEGDLKPLVDLCRWTDGHWEFGLGNQLKWNELQNVPRHIQMLSNFLLLKYKALVWGRHS